MRFEPICCYCLCWIFDEELGCCYCNNPNSSHCGEPMSTEEGCCYYMDKKEVKHEDSN